MEANDKLRRLCEYMFSCLGKVPEEVRGFEAQTEEDMWRVLDALANVICFSAQTAGVDKERLLENIGDIWDQHVRHEEEPPN